MKESAMGQFFENHNMSSSEKYSLRWNDFQDNTITAFSNLREDKVFTDVTLISEDGQHLEAHKVILTASSPFFMNILKINKHPNPIIYLKGFNANNLNSAIDFIYNGVANVYHENLDTFLALAEELQLKGLTGGVDKNEEIEENINLNNEQNRKKEMSAQFNKNEIDSYHKVKLTNSVIATTSPVAQVSFTGGSSEELKETLWSMITQEGTVLICTVCGKSKDKATDREAKKQMLSHVESLHMEGVMYECTKCEKTFRSKAALNTHTSRVHKQ